MKEQQTFADADALHPENPTEHEERAVAILAEICRLTGLDVRPVLHGYHAPYLEVELVGGDVSVTFGRHGQWLDSLQYLTNLVVGRRVGGDVRLVLDADNYRARRAETLQKLAHEYAEAVKERQEEAVLDPLPAHERRIIHSALLDDPAVRTYSEGDDPDRRVIIAPR